VSYAVRIRPAAQRQFARLPADAKKNVATAMEVLATEPRPHGHVKLTGSSDSYRMRVGDYRVIYQIDDAARTVRVTIIGHRREVYR
jgi:mRNA interferase RelE/StbE